MGRTYKQDVCKGFGDVGNTLADTQMLILATAKAKTNVGSLISMC